MTIAIWCILIAFTLPYVAFSLVKGLDPKQPRLAFPKLDSRSARAYAAQLNGFETAPFFAAAVIVAHMVRGPSGVVDALAVIYVLIRIGHLAAYLADRQPLRTTAFTVGQFVALAIFLSPLWR